MGKNTREEDGANLFGDGQGGGGMVHVNVGSGGGRGSIGQMISRCEIQSTDRTKPTQLNGMGAVLLDGEEAVGVRPAMDGLAGMDSEGGDSAGVRGSKGRCPFVGRKLWVGKGELKL